MSAPQARPLPTSWEQLVARVAELPHETLAWALAGQMATMGSAPEWDSQMVEWVAEYTRDAVRPLGLPTFTSSCDEDAALLFWCSVHPDITLDEFAERYDLRRPLTVIGAWHDGEPLAFGVVEGERPVRGDRGYIGYQPWATSVQAVSADEAMDLAVDEMKDGDQ